MSFIKGFVAARNTCDVFQSSTKVRLCCLVFTMQWDHDLRREKYYGTGESSPPGLIPPGTSAEWMLICFSLAPHDTKVGKRETGLWKGRTWLIVYEPWNCDTCVKWRQWCPHLPRTGRFSNTGQAPWCSDTPLGRTASDNLAKNGPNAPKQTNRKKAFKRSQTIQKRLTLPNALWITVKWVIQYAFRQIGFEGLR